MTLDREDIAAIAAEVARLLAGKCVETEVPLTLREAAQVCHVELLWLRERVQRKEIPAYRNGGKDSWRVFPKDVKEFLMKTTNKEPQRRHSVLRLAR